MTTFTALNRETQAGVTVLTLNRPDTHNLFDFALFQDLLTAFDEADQDDDVRVVVVTGSGRSFCAGADLSDGFIGEGVSMTPTLDRFLRSYGQINGVPRDAGGVLSLTIARSRKPVIAAINGIATGIGITMTLPMDIRIVARSARVGFVFTRRGLIPEAASSWFLPRLVGMARAMEWVATGRVFGAEEALTGGLATHVVDDDDLLPFALSIATEIVANTSPVAVAASRHLLWGMLSADSPWDAHALDSAAVYRMAGRADVAEGVRAFLEKRPAQFPLRVSDDASSLVPSWPRPADRHDVEQTEPNA